MRNQICNFVRFCFNDNKNTTPKSTKKNKTKTKKHIKTFFLNFNKNIQNVFTSMCISNNLFVPAFNVTLKQINSLYRVNMG